MEVIAKKNVGTKKTHMNKTDSVNGQKFEVP